MGFGFMNSLVYCPFISHFVASRASVMERVLFELRIQKTWSRHLLILWHCRPAAYSLWICKSGIILPAQYVSYGCEVKPMKYTWRYLVGFKKMYSGVVFICGGYLWFKRETSRLNSKKKKKKCWTYNIKKVKVLFTVFAGHTLGRVKTNSVRYIWCSIYV